MQTRLTKNQKQILTLLLNKYENSKSYAGENKIVQNFSISPKDVYKNYYSDFEDVDSIRQFEDELVELEQQNLIELEYDKRHILAKINVVKENIEYVYTLLGRVEKRCVIDNQIAFYKNVKSKHTLVQRFCLEQIERLGTGKKAVYELEDASNIISLCEAILSNEHDMLERELSIVVFGDTKIFEKKYRTKVCNMILSYGEYQELVDGINDKREIEQALLEEYQVYANPSYIHFKGHASIEMDNGNVIRLMGNEAIAFSTDTISHIRNIDIKDMRIMTVENLTSFNRMAQVDCFYIYLSGYHNTAKTAFLKMIAKQNKDKQWLHFGDIDPDGLYIYEHLKKKTGIEFGLYCMDENQLILYNKYTKELEKNDIVKARNMIDAGENESLMKYMLQNNCKLEQEIISWEIARGTIQNS